MGKIFRLFAPATFLLALVCLTGLTAAAQDSRSYPQVRSLLIADGFQPVKFTHHPALAWPDCLDKLCDTYPEVFFCEGLGDPCHFAFFRTSDRVHWMVSTTGKSKGLRLKSSRKATPAEAERIQKRQLLYYTDMRQKMIEAGYKPLALRHDGNESYCTRGLCKRFPEVFACAYMTPCQFIFFRASDRKYRVVVAVRDDFTADNMAAEVLNFEKVAEPTEWQLRDIKGRLR